jgi:hypothetical protein
MNFAVQARLSQDGTKIVSVALDPLPHPGVFAMISCDDIRQEFGVPDASNQLILDRANIRQTNTDALGEIANELFTAGCYSFRQGLHVVEITRSDLASRRDRFAWGQSDLPPSLGIQDRGVAVALSKFEKERFKVESLVRLLGYDNYSLSDPNLNGETGVDVIVKFASGRVAFQVTDFHSDEAKTSRGSEVRRYESRRVRDGLPAPSYINSNPVPGLLRRVEDKSKKTWSVNYFPHTNLLIAASVPESRGLV